MVDKPPFPAGVRTNQKKEKWREVSLGGKGELVPGGLAGGSSWCLLGRGINAATGAGAATWVVPRVGYPGHGPRAAAAAAYVPGGGRNRRHGLAAAVVTHRRGGEAAQNVPGTGHPGHELRAAAAAAVALTSYDGEGSGGVDQLVGQGASCRRLVKVEGVQGGRM
jgi:hypothetical protein